MRRLILRRMKELNQWYGDNDLDPQKLVAREVKILGEVANGMAKAGFPKLYVAGLKMRVDDSRHVVAYLSRCLKVLPAKTSTPAPPSDCLTVIQAAAVAGVGKRTIYRLCEEGRLPYARVGTGRGTIRVKRCDLDRFLEQARQPEQAEKDYLYS